METHDPVSADEAAAALAAAERTRARVAWGGYPAWYSLSTGAAVGAVCYAAVAAVLVFVAFAGTGLTMSARATRP